MQNSLLAHIASNFIVEYENVANSGICYLLNQYQTAREVLKARLELDKIPSSFVTELATKQNGRPDVTGLSQSGEKQIIIEGKFWANLTDNQPKNYLQELSKNGKLLFLVPEKRLISLKAQIEKRFNGINSKIVIYSWLDFLNQIERENHKNHNHKLASDLLQIKGLCQKMDTEGMPPLSISDLDPMNGKRLCHFSNIIDECNAILREWEYADFKKLKTQSSKYGHGFYFWGYSFGCYLHFDSKKWFTHDNHTPIWLSIKTKGLKDWEESEKINHHLKEYDAINSFGCYYGISLVAGYDKNQTIDDIIQKTKAVLVDLNEKIT